MTARRIQWIVWGTLGLIMAAIVVAYWREQATLSAARGLPRLFPVPSFTLTNQQGRPFSSEHLRGRVWLADIIFTRCAGPCPKMTGLVSELHQAIGAGSPASFVTLTTDPEFDTPEVLARYARRFQADPARWHFLTGSKAQIQDLAVNGLKLTALEKEEARRESPADLFIHSTIFVVVDKRGYVRAIIESDQPGARERTLSILRGLIKER